MSKKELRRQEILSAALAIFVQKGIHPTTTAEISSQAGIAAGTLFNYFNTKEDLINSLYIETKKEMITALEATLVKDNDYEVLVKRYWENGINWGINNYEKVRFLKQMDESPFIPESLKKEVEDLFSDFFNFYQTALNHQIIKNLPLDFSIALTYQSLLTTIDYIVQNIANPHFNRDEIIEKAFDVYYNGMHLK